MGFLVIKRTGKKIKVATRRNAAILAFEMRMSDGEWGYEDAAIDVHKNGPVLDVPKL